MISTFRIPVFIISILFAQVISACTPKDSAAQTSEAPGSSIVEVMIPDTEVRQLKSSATGRSYDIYVRLPDEYEQHQAKKYPVLYVLDGQWDFKLLDSIYGGLYHDGFVPEMIIIGITYSGDHPDYGALRAMDYTPVRDVFFGGSGDAPRFFAFLKEELLPFIEENYRADPSQRVLMGSSFGGTFTLYALFTEPTLFSGYVSGSPIVPYGDGFALRQEAEYARKHKDLPVRLFLSVGEVEEMARPVNEFSRILSERNYTGLKMEMRTIPGEAHASNKPETYNRGLRFIFQDE
jgi:predicted alpha/beta superfamily hydrolase